MYIGILSLLYTAQNSCKHVFFMGVHLVQTFGICFLQLVVFRPYFLVHPLFQVAKRVVEERETLEPRNF